MEPTLKLKERAERYRQIAQNTFDAKIAGEIEKIAQDYEHWATADEGSIASRREAGN
jgi:hypothetical protein